jgi:hypothetical protein
MDKSHAKTIPMSEILDKLNIQPQRVSNNKAVFLSPWRNERTASFWVYLKSNSWYDYGEAVGGDTIAFAQHYLKSTNEAHTMPDALRWLKNMSGDHFVIPAVPFDANCCEPDESSLVLRELKSIQYVGLVHYLNKRGIELSLARKHLKQLHIFNKTNGKKFIALGFKNEDGGYELRNQFFKGSLRPKTITFIRGRKPQPKGIHLIEGSMDYLSAIMQAENKEFDNDTIVLNSIVNLKHAFAYIKNYGYKVVYSWMDHDRAGEKATEIIKEFCKTQDDLRHVAKNYIYAPHKDVNAWHMHKNNLTL